MPQSPSNISLLKVLDSNTAIIIIKVLKPEQFCSFQKYANIAVIPFGDIEYDQNASK